MFFVRSHEANVIVKNKLSTDVTSTNFNQRGMSFCNIQKQSEIYAVCKYLVTYQMNNKKGPLLFYMLLNDRIKNARTISHLMLLVQNGNYFLFVIV